MSIEHHEKDGTKHGEEETVTLFPLFLLHFLFFGPGYCRNENEKQRKGGKTRKRNRVRVRVKVKVKGEGEEKGR